MTDARVAVQGPAVRRDTASLERPARRILIAANAVGALCVLASIFEWWGAPSREVLDNLSFETLMAMSTILFFFSALSQPGRWRGAWLLVSAGLFAALVGSFISIIYVGMTGAVPSPSIADAFYLAFYPLVMAGLLRFPRAVATREEAAGFALDAVAVLFGTGMIVAHFLIIPTLQSVSGGLTSLLVAAAFPLGDVLLFFGLDVTRGAPPLAPARRKHRRPRGRSRDPADGRPAHQLQHTDRQREHRAAERHGSRLVDSGGVGRRRAPAPQVGGRERSRDPDPRPLRLPGGLRGGPGGVRGAAPRRRRHPAYAARRDDPRRRRRDAAPARAPGDRLARERDPPRAEGLLRDRGPLPVPRDQLLRHHLRHRRVDHDPLRHAVGAERPGLRCRQSGGLQAARHGPRRRPQLYAHARLALRGAARQQRARRVAHERPRGLLALHGDRGRQPARGSARREPGVHLARYRGAHPLPERAPAPGLPRRAHRPRQQDPVQRPGGARPGAGRADRRPDRRALHGHRRLQARQRQLRPRARRSAARAGGRAPRRSASRQRHRRPARRRRVRHPPARGRPTPARHAASRNGRWRCSSRASAWTRPSSPSRSASAWPCRTARTPRVRSSCGMRTWPCTRPRRTARTASRSSSPRCRRPSTSVSSWPTSCARPSTTTNSSCTTSRSSTSPPSASWRPRPWSAGTTRARASCIPAGSSRSPRRRASSSPSATWSSSAPVASSPRWEDRFPDTALRMAVNLSPRQLKDPELIDKVRSVLQATGVEPGRLTLEITETALVEDSHATLTRLRAAQGAGDPPLDRRLRDRLLVTELPSPVPGGRRQDREAVRRPRRRG